MAIASPTKEENLFSDEDFKKYFRIDLEYCKKSDKWPNETILHFVLTDDRISSEGSLLIGHLKQTMGEVGIVSLSTSNFSLHGKLMNSGQEHAEKKLFNAFESGYKKYKEARPDEKDKKATSKNFEPDLSDTMSRMSIKDKEKSMDEKMALSLNILINYSPCSNCANIIIAFKNTCDIRISIRFGSFYKFYPKNDDNRNKKGLKDLKHNNILLDLIWEYEPLKKQIEKIGDAQAREKRKEQDQTYLNLVNEAA